MNLHVFDLSREVSLLHYEHSINALKANIRRRQTDVMCETAAACTRSYEWHSFLGGFLDNVPVFMHLPQFWQLKALENAIEIKYDTFVHYIFTLHLYSTVHFCQVRFK